jgi:cell division protein FtsQ
MSEVIPTAVRSGRSWREISQEVKPRAMSRKGRHRQHVAWLKAGAVTALVCGLAYGGYTLVHDWETDRAAFADTVNSEPVRDLSVDTRGTLTKQWVGQVLALPKGATLMALDLPALRKKLMEQGQVMVAVVERSFPDLLVVKLQERFPVARLQAQDGSGRPKQLFVAKDGVVYEGTGYNAQMVGGLPWLDGIRLVRQGSGYAPIEGMADVANLLAEADVYAPHLYRNWLIVSLAKLAERDEIIVKSQDIPEIVFSRKRDAHQQVAELDAVIDRAKQRPEAVLHSVNLALAGQVPVKFEQSPDELSRQEYSPQFILQPIKRKGQRDF